MLETYVLPVGRLSGLLFPVLIAPNSISIGATLYEYGDKNTNGICNFLRVVIMAELWAYGAPSCNIIVFSLQFLSSLSNVLTSSLIYRSNIVEVVLTYVNDAYISPSLERAIIILIRGVTFLTGIECVEPFGAQIMRWKFNYVNSDSSKFMILLLVLISFK